MKSTHLATIAGLAVVALNAAAAQAAFTININYTGDAAYQSFFTAAKSTWQSVVTGYKPGVTLTGLTINASVSAIDGPGGTLAQAGPTSGVVTAGTTYATNGTMQFDSADIASLSAGGSFGDVVLHEMGHVLGIGTLWTDNGLYVDGSGQYTGVAGLAAYKTEFNQPLATYVPVELGGGGGTADGHWNEVDGGSANTGIVSNITGQDFKYELMTGWLNAPTFLSTLTRYSMVDLGYTVSVPEPAALAVLAVGVGVALRRRRAC